ncbi:Oxoglutarate/iron-dependent dioxygenase [Macleaya cordata]|uniref:Oxoglutarate/iron-dependent dioxygenase n=1 Tax=Macleaya cordata TaxID=56857 RepID=A0A200Q627_MACCD|nr:Oxoglutarate/iron-dependent dioxygenase [Macleaya cordata]
MEEQMSSDCFHEVSFIDKHGQLRCSKVPVVQELARQGLQNLPDNRFLLKPDHQQHHHLPIIVPSQEVHLPVINMANLLDPNHPDLDQDQDQTRAHQEELERLARGVKEWGLFLVVNHGIPSNVLTSLEEVVKGFFNLSFHEKKASVGTYSNNIDNMGYGRNFVKSEDQPLDWIDRLTMRAAPKVVDDTDDDDDDGVLHVWPRQPSNFRQVMEKYVDHARRVCEELLQALAEAVSFERHRFLRNFEPSESVVMNVRVNYYPPCPKPDQVLGLTPHSDASALTLLVQFGSSNQGLQVFKDKQWFTVKPWPTNALLVNVGDLLEIMSNGRKPSPWHRVATHKDKERFSVAVFYNPPPQAELEPIRDQGSVDLINYKKVVVEDYLQHFYKVSPTKEKQAILFARV